MTYVLVPCKVMIPGLQPRIRIIREDSLVTAGMTAAILSLEVAGSSKK
jgi:hypothetical protein